MSSFFRFFSMFFSIFSQKFFSFISKCRIKLCHRSEISSRTIVYTGCLSSAHISNRCYRSLIIHQRIRATNRHRSSQSKRAGNATNEFNNKTYWFFSTPWHNQRISIRLQPTTPRNCMHNRSVRHHRHHTFPRINKVLVKPSHQPKPPTRTVPYNMHRNYIHKQRWQRPSTGTRKYRPHRKQPTSTHHRRLTAIEQQINANQYWNYGDLLKWMFRNRSHQSKWITYI